MNTKMALSSLVLLPQQQQLGSRPGQNKTAKQLLLSTGCCAASRLQRKQVPQQHIQQPGIVTNKLRHQQRPQQLDGVVCRVAADAAGILCQNKTAGRGLKSAASCVFHKTWDVAAAIKSPQHLTHVLFFLVSIPAAADDEESRSNVLALAGLAALVVTWYGANIYFNM